MFVHKETKKARKIGKKRGIIWLCIFFVILFLYLGFSLFFMNHYFFNTYINEMACSGKSVKVMQQDIIDQANNYHLNIIGREGLTDSITSEDVLLIPEFSTEFARLIKNQKAFLWPFFVFKKTDYTVDMVVNYSKEELDKKIDQLIFFQKENIREPKNAYLSDYTENGYVVVPEDNGTVLIRENVYRVIEDAVDILETEIDLNQLKCYKTVDITKEDPKLNKLCSNLNQYLKANITYVFGKDSEIVNGNLIKDWLTINDTKVSLNEELVREYVNSLSRKYDTFGKKREFQTTSGNTITISEGAYGWWMNRPEETKGLIKAIMNGETGMRSPVYRAIAAQYGDSDIGDSYVEIDLTSQHLWVYKDGVMVVESDFVSGNVNKGNGTPVGIYGITYKERDATLKGENYSSDVSFWMPFNGNVGMHDATWRSMFGGDIYLTNGSHGCINLPYQKANEIFNNVEKGEAVIVYGGAAPTVPIGLQQLTPEQQLQLLIEAGLLNPDGTPIAPPAPPTVQ